MSTVTRVRIPSYRRHKATGQAVVTLDGRDVYLGKWGTAASRTEYNRLIAEWVSHDGKLPTSAGTDFTLVELLAAFLRHASRYYLKPDGSATSELGNFKRIIGRVKRLYGGTLVCDFGPLALKAIRHGMVKDELTRTGVNHDINRIRHIVKWGVENELVPPSILQALQAVAGLRYGRTDAVESEPIRPVPDAFVDAVLPHVSPQVAAMVELQRLTGMRSGEVTIMRGCDLDTSGKVWTYKPAAHKNLYRGFERVIYLGPNAQNALRQWLRTDLQAYLFRPGDAVTAWLKKRHASRKTPLSCGNRPGRKRRNASQRVPREHYDTASYRRAIKRGVTAENKARLKAARIRGVDPERVELVPDWHPHQLRHNRATELRRLYGLEVARILLGHKTAVVTEIYAEADHARAIEVMGKIG